MVLAILTWWQGWGGERQDWYRAFPTAIQDPLQKLSCGVSLLLPLETVKIFVTWTCTLVYFFYMAFMYERFIYPREAEFLSERIHLVLFSHKNHSLSGWKDDSGADRTTGKFTFPSLITSPWVRFLKHAELSDVHTCVLRHVQHFVTPCTGAHQALLSLKFSRQEYWSRLPFSSPGALPNLGIEPTSLAFPALAGRFFTNCATWLNYRMCCNF